MRVKNKTEHGVFVSNYGVVPAGEEATVRESEQVKQMIKDDVLAKVATPPSANNEEGDG